MRIRYEGHIAGEHARVWARGASVTDPVHVHTAAWLHGCMAAWLRKQYQQPRAVAAAGGDDLARDPADYSRAFGLSDSTNHGDGVS